MPFQPQSRLIWLCRSSQSPIFIDRQQITINVWYQLQIEHKNHKLFFSRFGSLCRNSQNPRVMSIPSMQHLANGNFNQNSWQRKVKQLQASNIKFSIPGIVRMILLNIDKTGSIMCCILHRPSHYQQSMWLKGVSFSVIYL